MRPRGRTLVCSPQGVNREPSEADPVTLIETAAPGFVVVTQSCDIVRRYEDRRFVVLAPLVKVSESDLPTIKKGYRPAVGGDPWALNGEISRGPRLHDDG